MSLASSRAVDTSDSAPELSFNPEEIQEYNAFGPWAYEIKSAQEMPPRFQDWYAQLAESHFLLKFPIDKERRLVGPGQDLYRQVLAIDDQRITVLTANGAEVDCRVVAFADIQAVRSQQILLWGELEFYLATSDKLAIRYNAVSRPIIEKALDFLRRKWEVPRGDTVKVSTTSEPLVSDYYFVNLVQEYQRRQPRAQLIYVEEPGLRCSDLRGRRRRGLGILILESGGDYLFLNRGKPFRTRWEAVHGISCTCIPKQSIQGLVMSEPNPNLPKAGRELQIQLSGQMLSFQLFGENAALEQLVQRLSASR